MNIPNYQLALLGIVFLFLPSTNFALPINWLSPDLENVQQRAQQEDKIFLLYFTADWCLPCQWMQENTFQDPELGQFMTENILAVKVDLNHAQAKELQHQFEVQVIPTILVFATNGKLIDQRSASVEAKHLLRWFKKLDKPANHVSATLPANDIQVAMDAPLPKISFSRPALVPDDDEPQLLSNQEVESPETPALVLSGEPIIAAYTGLAPRSSLSYGIQLKGITVDYPTAIRLVSEMERKYEQTTELKPDGQGQFHLVLGSFSSTGEARQFLQFLQRNNREGEIVPLSH